MCCDTQAVTHYAVIDGCNSPFRNWLPLLIQLLCRFLTPHVLQSSSYKRRASMISWVVSSSMMCRDVEGMMFCLHSISKKNKKCACTFQVEKLLHSCPQNTRSHTSLVNPSQFGSHLQSRACARESLFGTSLTKLRSILTYKPTFFSSFHLCGME